MISIRSRTGAASRFQRAHSVWAGFDISRQRPAEITYS